MQEEKFYLQQPGLRTSSMTLNHHHNKNNNLGFKRPANPLISYNQHMLGSTSQYSKKGGYYQTPQYNFPSKFSQNIISNLRKRYTKTSQQPKRQILIASAYPRPDLNNSGSCNNFTTQVNKELIKKHENISSNTKDGGGEVKQKKQKISTNGSVSILRDINQQRMKLAPYNDPSEILFNPQKFFDNVVNHQQNEEQQSHTISLENQRQKPLSRPQSSSIQQQKLLYRAQQTSNPLFTKVASQLNLKRPSTSFQGAPTEATLKDATPNRFSMPSFTKPVKMMNNQQYQQNNSRTSIHAESKTTQPPRDNTIYDQKIKEQPSDRPQSSNQTSGKGRGYSYFYEAKLKRNYNRVSQIDQFMTNLELKQTQQKQDLIEQEWLKDFPFSKEYIEYTRSKLQWEHYERQWQLYQKQHGIIEIQLPMPPCKFGLFFHIHDKLTHTVEKDSSKEYPFNDGKRLKKVKQEIMMRYHPDKHQYNSNIAGDKNIEEINEICGITNKIFEKIRSSTK